MGMLRKGWMLTGGMAVVLATGTGTAQASSYELVMVMDSGTRSIHRFDGTTGRYMGEFGRGFLANPVSFAVDGRRGLAHVGDSRLGLVRTFDYSTGVHLQDLNISNGQVQSLTVLPGGNLLSGFFIDSAHHYTPQGTSVGFPSIVRINGQATVSGSSANHASGRTLMVTQRLDRAPGLMIQSALVGTTNFTAASGVLSDTGDYTRNHQLAVSGNVAALVSELSADIRYYTVSANGQAVNSTFSVSVATTFQTLRGVSYGHGSTVYVSGRNAANTSGLVMRTLQNDNFNYGTFGEGILQQPGSIQSVIAPEPGTLIATGMGLAALVARRRRRKQ